MATDDYTLANEVRVQTGVSDTTFSDSDLRTLIGRAKREIEREIEASVSDWYATTDHESALYWLTSMMLVEVTDKTESGTKFQVGELQYEPLTDSNSGPFPFPQAWQTRYNSAVAAVLGSSSVAMGSVKVDRSDRTYGE